ncbi:MAG: PilZ domain-containing protein [Candidatus Omnitrophica bacterium]|nr:PilZ domain-containing protein [Candidatus Omnitrophota bacterium]
MGRERRRFERFESLVSVKYTARKGDFTGYSFTKDLSEEGVGLPMASAIPRRGPLDLIIIIPGGDFREIRATAKVAWFKRNLEHWKSYYSAGLRFKDISPTDKNRLLAYAKNHRWVKSSFEQQLEEDKVPVLGGKGDFDL